MTGEDFYETNIRFLEMVDSFLSAVNDAIESGALQTLSESDSNSSDSSVRAIRTSTEQLVAAREQLAQEEFRRDYFYNRDLLSNNGFHEARTAVDTIRIRLLMGTAVAAEGLVRLMDEPFDFNEEALAVLSNDLRPAADESEKWRQTLLNYRHCFLSLSDSEQSEA